VRRQAVAKSAHVPLVTYAVRGPPTVRHAPVWAIPVARTSLKALGGLTRAVRSERPVPDWDVGGGIPATANIDDIARWGRCKESAHSLGMRLPQDCSLRRIIGVGLPVGLSYVPTKLARVSQFDVWPVW